MTEFERDFDKFELSGHGINQVQDRQIGVREIRRAIEEGEIVPERGDEEHEVAYVLDLPVDFVLIVDTRDNTIETLYYDDEQGAEGGALGGRRFDTRESLL